MGFYKVAHAFNFLTACFSMTYLSNISCKKLVCDFRDMLCPVPLYHSFYPQGPGQDVLRPVKNVCIAPSVKTFFIKLHTSTLHLKTWLRERGVFVLWTTDFFFFLRKRLESIGHLFIEFWDAILFWGGLKKPLKKTCI